MKLLSGRLLICNCQCNTTQPHMYVPTVYSAKLHICLKYNIHTDTLTHTHSLNTLTYVLLLVSPVMYANQYKLSTMCTKIDSQLLANTVAT